MNQSILDQLIGPFLGDIVTIFAPFVAVLEAGVSLFNALLGLFQ